MPDPIKALQNELVCTYRQIIGCDRDCKGCHLVFEDTEIISAYEAAIEALKNKSEIEKYQTPKKIVHFKYIDGSIDDLCPTCCHVLLPHLTNFCSYCGQALDWSEV